MNDKIIKRMEQLERINSNIKQLDHEELAHLYELVRLYNEALYIVGDLVAESAYVKDTAYLERKRIHAETVINGTGTVAMKEANAELTIHEYRKQERDANALYIKFKNRQSAIENSIVDLRQKRNRLENELQAVNDRR
ncbi:hypothetical protein [Gracilibacillus thailandensis]|uniref:Uncharacterized protein n=1 Tax=Gracilibacillus thailandensis TaxID=563735 RepID=A0A6N7QSV5_9BACI|nr:hypothetical protein [Gracilibacillus thailandensis]MRI65123.1 hypothetical protein [Gracilibacillus thailandensis]